MRACFEVPDHLRAPGALEPDSCGMPAEPLPAGMRAGLAQHDTRLWIPTGTPWGLHVEHDHRVLAGPFVGPEKWGLTWHITVSPWETVDSMRDVLHAKHAEVHFVIGARKGVKEPVVIQCLPLDQFGKGMMHPAGTPETNRAFNIQVEVCATPESIRSFTHYKALANLAALISHGRTPRVPIPRRQARSFQNTKRFTPAGYPRVEGHHGHQHAASNTHFDPTTAFEGATLMRLIGSAPHGL